MTVRVWFSPKHEPDRPWLIWHQDNTITCASAVSLTDVETHYRPDAFKALPGGPKGIIEGKLVDVWDEAPVT